LAPRRLRGSRVGSDRAGVWRIAGAARIKAAPGRCTHTHSEAYPSETDVRLAFYPEARYILVSLTDREQPVMRSFSIVEGEVTEQELIVT
jgi:hypothetical protein